MEQTFMLVPGRYSPLLRKARNGPNKISHTPKDNFLRVVISLIPTSFCQNLMHLVRTPRYVTSNPN